MKGRNSSVSNALLYDDKEEEFNQFNGFFLSHKTSVGFETKKERIVLVEENKDNLEKSTLAKNIEINHDRFFGCNRNYTGPLENIPDDSILNAPVEDDGKNILIKQIFN